MSNSRLHIGLIPLGRRTFDIEYANEVFDRAQAELRSSGFSLHGPTSLITAAEDLESGLEELASADLDLALLLQTTFADSSMVLQVANTLSSPLLLWAVPEPHTGGRLRLNSLCGINLAAHALKRAGIRYETLYADPNNKKALESVRTKALAGRAFRLLRQAKIGRIGEHPDGFDTCQFDAQELQSVFGVEVIQFELDDLFNGARNSDQEAVEKVFNRIEANVTDLHDLDPQATRKSLASYLTLRSMAQSKNLSGLAVRCWPEFFTDLGCAACSAMSMLSDELIPCSCEADVNGTLTQMILQYISEEPAFGTDIVSLDEERDALVIWHCGLAPRSMADPQEPVRGIVHSNRNLPLLFEFALKPGPVTVARLTESSDQISLVVGRGRILRGPKSFSGTSGLLHFKRPAREVLDFILSEGLEHHISITYGDFADVLISFASLVDIPILQLTD